VNAIEVTALYGATGDAFARIGGSGDVTLALEGTGIGCLAVDQRGREPVFAGSRGRGVWRSEDGGRTWGDAGLPQPDVFSLAVSAQDGAVYAGCEPSMLFRSDDGGATWRELSALRELPSAPTWSFPPRPWTSHVRWIAPSPHEAGTLLVGIELGRLMRSNDGGETWADHAPGAQRDVHSLAWHPVVEGRAYEAGGGGAAWSFDAGTSWRPADDGRDRHYTWAVTVDVADPELWYVSASRGPSQAHGRGSAEAAIYRWRGDGPWEPVLSELDSMPYALVAREGELIAGLADGRLLRSADEGGSWDELAALPAIIALA